MGLSTYSGIKTAIAEYLGQDNLTSQLDSFINICESRINNTLRVRRMETFSNTTITAGDDSIDLPAHFHGMRGIYVQGSPQYTIEYLTPEQLNNVANTAGRPKYYTIRGDKVLFAGDSDSTYTIRMHYIGRFDPLSDATTTNWLTLYKPEVYIYGSLQAACEFTGDDDGAERFGSLFRQALAEIQRSDDYEKYGAVPVMKTEGVRW